MSRLVEGEHHGMCTIHALQPGDDWAVNSTDDTRVLEWIERHRHCGGMTLHTEHEGRTTVYLQMPQEAR